MAHADGTPPLPAVQQQHPHQQQQIVRESPTGAQPDPAADNAGVGEPAFVDEPGQALSEAAAADGSGPGACRAAGVPDEEEARRGKKKVRFQEPYLAPPHRREGQQPRSALSPESLFHPLTLNPKSCCMRWWRACSSL